MNCLFCKKELTDPTREELDGEEPPGYRIFAEYECRDCRAEFVMCETIGQITEYKFQYKKYTLDFDVPNSKFKIIAMKISGNDRDGAFVSYEDIINLNFLPDLTPQNVEAKLPIYITFS